MSIDPRVIAGLITEDPDVFSEGPNKEYGRNSETRRKVFELMGVNTLKELNGKWVHIRKHGEDGTRHGSYKIYRSNAEYVYLSRADGVYRNTKKKDRKRDPNEPRDYSLIGMHWLSFLKYATPLEKHVEGSDSDQGNGRIHDYSFDELD